MGKKLVFRFSWKRALGNWVQALVVVAVCIGLAGCPESANHPIVGNWRLFIESFDDGEFVGTDTAVVNFTGWGTWTMPTADGNDEIAGTWRETSPNSVLSDISDQRTIDGVLLRQDLTYNLIVDEDSLSGDGIVNFCFDFDCISGEQTITGVRL